MAESKTPATKLIYLQCPCCSTTCTLYICTHIAHAEKWSNAFSLDRLATFMSMQTTWCCTSHMSLWNPFAFTKILCQTPWCSARASWGVRTQSWRTVHNLNRVPGHGGTVVVWLRTQKHGQARYNHWWSSGGSKPLIFQMCTGFWESRCASYTPSLVLILRLRQYKKDCNDLSSGSKPLLPYVFQSISRCWASTLTASLEEHQGRAYHQSVGMLQCCILHQFYRFTKLLQTTLLTIWWVWTHNMDFVVASWWYDYSMDFLAASW